MDVDELVRIFQNVGLAEKKAKETANNKKIGPIFHTAIVEVNSYIKLNYLKK